MIKRENTVIFDDRGIPSIMVKFTKESNKSLFGGSDKTNAMFIIGGEEHDEIHISKYLNTIINDRPYSLPFTEPATNITNDEAAKLCLAKGEGWHMLTAPEWGYLALDSLRNGTLPHGNTDRGHYHANRNEKGQTYDGYRTFTGSGPATWSHDHTPLGVYDLCGNVWEMVRGLRLMNGDLQAAKNNDAALNIDLGENSTLWEPVMDGKDIVRSEAHDAFSCNSHGSRWKDVVFECNITEQLRELAFFAGEPEAYLFADTEGERFPLRGGRWSSTSHAGVFYSNLGFPRAHTSANFGFRSAFYRKTGNRLLMQSQHSWSRHMRR